MTVVRFPEGRYMIMPTNDETILLTCMDEKCRDTQRHFVYQDDALRDFSLYADAVWNHERQWHVGPSA